MSDQDPVKRGPGRPPKMSPATEAAVRNYKELARPATEPSAIELLQEIAATLKASARVPSDWEPMQAVRFSEAVPVGNANHVEMSASTTADGKIKVFLDWERRVVVIQTKGEVAPTLVPLEIVRSMKPMAKKAKQENAA